MKASRRGNMIELATFPILRRHLAGKRWLINTGSRYFLGGYESKQIGAFMDLLKPGDVAFDVGANIGYYTLTGAICVGPRGKVFAFEPLPHNIKRLRRHLEANRCGNVTLIEAAVSDHEGTARFENRCSPGTAHLSPDGPVTVKLVSLDELHRRGDIPLPTVMKIDVESAELQVLKGASGLLSSVRPAILLSTHGQSREAECSRFLTNLGYELVVLKENPYKELATRRKEFLAVSQQR